MMSMADRLAGAVRGPVVGLRDVKVNRWLVVDEPRELWTDSGARSRARARPAGRQDDLGSQVVLWASSREGPVELASATVLTGSFPPAPAPWAPVEGVEGPLPYETGALFHGPAFQVLRRLVSSAGGASSVLDAAVGPVGMGTLHPALLDGATHAIPHDRLDLWFAGASGDKVAFPALIPELDLFASMPAQGEVRCEVRVDEHTLGPDYPAFRIQLIGERGVIAQLRLIEATFPQGFARTRRAAVAAGVPPGPAVRPGVDARPARERRDAPLPGGGAGDRLAPGHRGVDLWHPRRRADPREGGDGARGRDPSRPPARATRLRRQFASGDDGVEPSNRRGDKRKFRKRLETVTQG